MKVACSVLLAASAMAIVTLGSQESYAADLLSEGPPAAPHSARSYAYPPQEYAAPGYEPAPVPQYRTYGESRYEPAPVPPAPIYGEPGYDTSGYAGPWSQGYEPRVYAAPAPQYLPAPQCYWTRGEPVWNGYGWSRRPVQVCN
jgi:hypothetical protein